MRVSVERGDRGYTPHPEDYEVFFNGVKQGLSETGRAIVTADEEDGTIVFHRSVKGRGIPVETCGDQFVTHTARGPVEIRTAPRRRPDT